jgi:hypothetical protein
MERASSIPCPIFRHAGRIEAGGPERSEEDAKELAERLMPLSCGAPQTIIGYKW